MNIVINIKYILFILLLILGSLLLNFAFLYKQPYLCIAAGFIYGLAIEVESRIPS